MLIKHIQKNIPVTPRKLRLVADMVRALKPEEAVRILSFTNKAAALPLSKAIKTALANAKLQRQDPDKFEFKTLEVNEGLAMKRFRAGTKGRIKPYKKRTSQIRIVLIAKGEGQSGQSEEKKIVKRKEKTSR